MHGFRPGELDAENFGFATQSLTPLLMNEIPVTTPRLVRDLMKVGVPPDIPLTAAAQMMRDRGVRVLFMMHHAGGIEYPAAMLTASHLMRHIAMIDEEDLRDLGIHAAGKSPVELFTTTTGVFYAYRTTNR